MVEHFYELGNNFPGLLTPEEFAVWSKMKPFTDCSRNDLWSDRILLIVVFLSLAGFILS